MVQKVPKDMVITAEIRLLVFAAIETVKFHYKTPQSMRSMMPKFSICPLCHILWICLSVQTHVCVLGSWGSTSDVPQDTLHLIFFKIGSLASTSGILLPPLGIQHRTKLCWCYLTVSYRYIMYSAYFPHAFSFLFPLALLPSIPTSSLFTFMTFSFLLWRVSFSQGHLCDPWMGTGHWSLLGSSVGTQLKTVTPCGGGTRIVSHRLAFWTFGFQLVVPFEGG